MNIVRNILAVIVGIVVMGIVKSLVMAVGPMVIPYPPGSDLSTLEGLNAAMPLFGPQHFITPFLDHALGSLAGGFVAALIAASHKMKFALAIGALHLVGGIFAVYLIAAPLWFEALDLIVAYIPMAWLGGKLSGAGKE